MTVFLMLLHACMASSHRDRWKSPIYAIHWMGPFFSGSGYASEAASYMLPLKGRVHDSLLMATHYGDLTRAEARDAYSPHDLRSLEQMMKNAHKASQSLVTPSIIICHSTANQWLAMPQGDDSPICPPDPRSHAFVFLVGRTMWEAEEVPETFIPRLMAMNEVWVPSTWNARTFIEAGIPARKVRVIKQGVNVTWLDPDRHPPANLTTMGSLLFGGWNNSNPRPPFRFMSAFKWERRKGWDILLSSYLQEFTSDDHVELFILTRPYSGTEGLPLDAFVKGWVQGNLGGLDQSRFPAVRLITDRISDAAWPSFYSAADSFVLPTRGEGWGRPLVEAMSMSLPVLATNSSAMTDYLDSQVGYPLRFTLEVVDDKEDDFNRLRMAFASISHTREMMRHVATHPMEAKMKGRRARARMVRDYSLEVVSEVLLTEISRIESLIP